MEQCPVCKDYSLYIYGEHNSEFCKIEYFKCDCGYKEEKEIDYNGEKVEVFDVETYE